MIKTVFSSSYTSSKSNVTVQFWQGLLRIQSDLSSEPSLKGFPSAARSIDWKDPKLHVKTEKLLLLTHKQGSLSYRTGKRYNASKCRPQPKHPSDHCQGGADTIQRLENSADSRESACYHLKNFPQCKPFHCLPGTRQGLASGGSLQCQEPELRLFDKQAMTCHSPSHVLPHCLSCTKLQVPMPRTNR